MTRPIARIARGLSRWRRRIERSRRLRDALLDLTRVVPGRMAHRYRGIWAYRLRRWRIAERELDAALAGSSDRATLLHAASVQQHLGGTARRDAYVAECEHTSPSPLYDSGSAFAVSTKRPWERESAARYLARNADRLRRIAESRLTTTPAKRYAFVYWDTVERPDVVQHCIDSMRQWCPPDLELVELHAENLADWVRMDPRIMHRVDMPAHGADLIRLHLLSTYGGLWLDASCLLNESFPAWVEEVRRQDLFLFTYEGSRTGNWFIWGEPGSYRLQLIRAALDSWFLDGGKWTNYFMFHDVVEMLYWTDERYRRDWDAGLHLHPGRCFDVHHALGTALTDADWADVRHAQPINKLSWRKYNAPELRSDPSTGVSRLMAEPLGRAAAAEAPLAAR